MVKGARFNSDSQARSDVNLSLTLIGNLVKGAGFSSDSQARSDLNARNLHFVRVFIQKWSFRSCFCSKMAISYVFLVRNGRFARVFVRKWRFRTCFCAKMVVLHVFWLKNDDFVRVFGRKVRFGARFTCFSFAAETLNWTGGSRELGFRAPVSRS